MQNSKQAESQVPSVSELTRRIRELLEPAFDEVRVEGELSNIKRSRNGHYYLTLKDSDAQLPCVIWNRTARRLGTEPEEGQQVILGGSLQIYPPHGRYQLIVRTLRQAGMGRLQQAFEALKRKLSEEGLFDVPPRPLPRFPERIGIITSTTGAAMHDILSTVEARWPLATVGLHHASVQGVHAAPELVRALKVMEKRWRPDLIIIGRGGGSLEDLWPFNEEAVARAIHAAGLPVISAVGHETDFSISDFVADHRAATPTQAAVMATPDIQEIRIWIDDQESRASRIVGERIDRGRQRVGELSRSHALLAVRQKLESRRLELQNVRERLGRHLTREIPRLKQRTRELQVRLERRLERLSAQRKERMNDLQHRLEARNPNRPLEQGFVRVWQNGEWVRSPDRFRQNERLELEWHKKRITL